MVLVQVSMGKTKTKLPGVRICPMASGRGVGWPEHDQFREIIDETNRAGSLMQMIGCCRGQNAELRIGVMPIQNLPHSCLNFRQDIKGKSPTQALSYGVGDE